LSSCEPTRSLKCPRLEGGIELRNVTCRYSPTSPAVLDDISLRIEPGKKVAFVGPSGSEKSTLARLLLGLQETALFDGTTADNLRLFHRVLGAPRWFRAEVTPSIDQRSLIS
jgi:ABC-type bacteriocin/lantibiotic exporter with double-glycine peptidase domain